MWTASLRVRQYFKEEIRNILGKGYKQRSEVALRYLRERERLECCFLLMCTKSAKIGRASCRERV